MVQVTQIEGITAAQFFAAIQNLEAQIKAMTETKSTRQQIANEAGYLTRGEVITLLRVSAVTVNDWTNKGFIKAYRMGNKVYYKRSEIDAAMVEIKKGGRQ